MIPCQRKRKASIVKEVQRKPKKTKGAAPDQENAPSETQQPAAHYRATSSESTAASDQRKKLLALLLQGPKTTIDLRRQGIMMPAARVHELRHDAGHIISSELLAQYDDHGYRHKKVARYCLIKLAGVEA